LDHGSRKRAAPVKNATERYRSHLQEKKRGAERGRAIGSGEKEEI